MTHQLVSIIVILLSASLPSAAALKVHGIFGSHMVIQRDKPVEAEERLKFRRTEEATQAVKILEKLEALPKPQARSE